MQMQARKRAIKHAKLSLSALAISLAFLSFPL